MTKQEKVRAAQWRNFNFYIVLPVTSYFPHSKREMSLALLASKSNLKGKRKLFLNLTSPKWALDSAAAANFVVDSNVHNEDYIEVWHIADLTLNVRWPRWAGTDPTPWLTEKGRYQGLVTGKNLGGYIGVSLGYNAEGKLEYHIGTPAGTKSGRLVEAMKIALAKNDGQSTQTTEVFKLRDQLLPQFVKTVVKEVPTFPYAGEFVIETTEEWLKWWGDVPWGEKREFVPSIVTIEGNRIKARGEIYDWLGGLQFFTAGHAWSVGRSHMKSIRTKDGQLLWKQ